MPDFTIDMQIEGLPELQKRLANSPERFVAALNDFLRGLGHLFVPAKGVGPLAAATPRRSGKLAKSTHFRITDNAMNQQLSIEQPARTKEGYVYGAGVRGGTRPHIIRPRRARALRFTVGSGQIVFAQVVHHPGNAPNPYHWRVFQSLRPQMNMLMHKVGLKLKKHLSGG